MSAEKSETFYGLDLGTTKICAIVAQMVGENIKILGMGTYPSTGLRKGIVVDIKKTSDCIVEAIAEAERASGKDITSVFVGIAGGHVKSQNVPGKIAVSEDGVTDGDLKRLIENTNAKVVSPDREIIQAVASKYSIDGQKPVSNPLGMRGQKIEADIHIVSGQVADTKNLIDCIHRIGLDVNGIVLEQIASSMAVLTETEKDLGVVLVDCGGGTTDIAVFGKGGILKYTQNITLGGDNIDRDISHRFNTVSDMESRKVKEDHGVALARMARTAANVEIRCADTTTRMISQRDIAEVIEPRMREILELARDEIPAAVAASSPTSKVVLTGGSLAMEGAVEMAKEIFGMEARLGVPVGIYGDNEEVCSPAFSTGVGLIHYGVESREHSGRIRVRDGKIFEKVHDWMNKWFAGYF